MKRLIKLFSAGKPNKKKIESFSVVTLRTSGMRYTEEIVIESRKESAFITHFTFVYPNGKEERRPVKENVCDNEAVLKLLNECDLLSWDGFFGPQPRGVMDGTMFSLRARVNGETQISASGSQNFPKRYRDFTAGLSRLLDGNEGGTP